MRCSAGALQGRFFEFGKVVQDFRYGTSNKSGETGLPTLRIPNVVGGRIDTTEIKTVEVTPSERERLRLQEGDVLFVRTNGNPDYVGRCAAFSTTEVAGNGNPGRLDLRILPHPRSPLRARQPSFRNHVF